MKVFGYDFIVFVKKCNKNENLFYIVEFFVSNYFDC